MGTISPHICLDAAFGSIAVCGLCHSVGGKRATGVADNRNNTDLLSSCSAEMMYPYAHKVSRGYRAGLVPGNNYSFSAAAA